MLIRMSYTFLQNVDDNFDKTTHCHFWSTLKHMPYGLCGHLKSIADCSDGLAFLDKFFGLGNFRSLQIQRQCSTSNYWNKIKYLGHFTTHSLALQLISLGTLGRIQFNFQFNSIYFPSKQQTHLKTHKMEEMQLKAKAWKMLHPLYN